METSTCFGLLVVHFNQGWSFPRLLGSIACRLVVFSVVPLDHYVYLGWMILTGLSTDLDQLTHDQLLEQADDIRLTAFGRDGELRVQSRT